MDLDRAYRMHKKELQIMLENCEKIAHQVDSAMEDAKSATQRLDGAAETTSKSVEVAKQQALSEFKNQLEKSSLKAKEEIRKWKSDTARTLSESEENLQCHKARLDNAIAMASQITKIGSPFEIASAYPVLSDTLQQLSKLQPITLPSRISIVEFHANNAILEITSLGTLVAGSRGYTQELNIQDEMMGDAKGITVAPSGDIVVAEFKPNRPVKVFNNKGLYLLRLKSATDTDCPWDVIVSEQGLYYVSTCGQNVLVYDFDGSLFLRIKPKTPFNPFLSSQTPDLRGLSINGKGQILIGDVKHNFISIHHPSGEQISGFSISIPPYFIAVSANDKVIVSASSRAGFQILNSIGHRLRSFDTMESVILNWVTGICCTSNGNIYVGNRKGMRGIHQFTEDGNYVGCITENVTNPWGIALTPAEDQLVVAEETSIKIVHLK
ncbi:uncharacterized protein [Amphiura filiformis]|uniref:uncharacterized protein n=1 Tax=Amphiura filiformis TaxID=82378 RepID=UPI003B225897